MAFDFKKSLIKVQGGRSYLPVSARLIWFREEHPDWGIHTEPLEINTEKQYAIFKATIYNAEEKIMAMGTKKEDVKGFGDYIEKAETGAVGRALALCGYGTQFSPELDEVGGGRMADSPYPPGNRQGGFSGGNRFGSGSNNYSSGTGYTQGGSRNDQVSEPAQSRFNPPREMSAPRDVVPPREAVPTREVSPPREAPTPRESANARDVGSAASTRPPTIERPAVADDDDDFETLIGGGEDFLSATEEDPFGDDAPNPTTAPAATASTPASASVGATPACNNCGKALTKAQQDLSIRNYGEALCPGCQKDKGRTKRPALAER